MMKEDRFFQDAMEKICGSLEFESALMASVNFLRQEMPVEVMFLQIFEPGLNAMRTMAIATAEEGRIVDLLTPLSDAALQELRSYRTEYVDQDLNHVWLFRDNPCDRALTREMFQFHGLKGTSLMVMPLVLGDEVVGAGSIVLVTEGEEKFSQQHADLLLKLKVPFGVAMSNALRHLEVVKLKERLVDDNRYLNSELLRLSGDEIVGAGFGLREVMSNVRQVAPTDSPVLLTGETGAGKDVIANAIHLGSPRREGPFIPVNCGAIPDSLLDSELFGHEKGAFTGALSRKRGRFERAHTGTILLDEIGEMPLQAQVRLLRVIQHREVERLGGTERIPVDIRIIAATNKDLGAMVRDRRFREDLWFRLNVFPINVPPLRERTNDIPALVQHFIERKTAELKIGDTPQLAPGAINELLGYHWPGNVRELENLLERAMILHRGEPLRFDTLGTSLPRIAVGGQTEADDESLELNLVIERHIRRVLGITGGKIHGPGGAGELLGVNPHTLRHRMKKLGIPFAKQLKGRG